MYLVQHHVHHHENACPTNTCTAVDQLKCAVVLLSFDGASIQVEQLREAVDRWDAVVWPLNVLDMRYDTRLIAVDVADTNLGSANGSVVGIIDCD